MASLSINTDLIQRLAAIDIGFSSDEQLEILATAIHSFLNPERTEPISLKDEDGSKSYLVNVINNLKAEFWAFFVGHTQVR
jgi:hypothetical protein